MEVDYGGFSIREYTEKVRSDNERKCWPFAGDLIQSFLPPITVSKFRWWSHELASLLTKSPVSVDDSDPSFRRKAKAKTRQCKKRSIVEICATAPKIQLAEDYVVHKKKIKTTKSKDSGDREFTNKVNQCKEQKVDDIGKCSLGIKESSGVMSLSSKKAGLVSKDHDSEFQIPAIFKAKRKVCFARSPDKSKTHVRFSDQSGNLSQLEKSTVSLQLCCLEMNRLSLSENLSQRKNQSSVNDKQLKVMSTDQTSTVMHLETRQQYKFQPAVSKSHLSCFLGPHLSSQERVTDALDLERKEYVAQAIQSFISTSSETPYRACPSFSQPVSADMHRGTLLYQSPFDPLPTEWMQKSVLNRQRHVGEAILGFPLDLQGDLVDANGETCRSFDRSGLCTSFSKSASTGNDLLLGNLVEFSSEKKHLIEAALAKDNAPLNEKRHKYFPARLGLDETFTEKAYLTNTNDGECGYTPLSEVNPRSHAINMSKRNGVKQNLNSGKVILKRDDLCLQNTQATMRLMGKDVSVSTSYSGMIRTGERIIGPDASIDYSSLGTYTHQSWVCQRTTLEVSENHSTTILDKNWNKALLRDTSKDPFPLFCEPLVSLASQSRAYAVPDSEFPSTILNPCCSLASFPLSEKNLNFHGSGLGPPNSFTLSQQQLPFPYDYNNVDIGLLPDARKRSFGLPLSSTNSARRSQTPWAQSSSENSCSELSFVNPSEQLTSFYGSRLSSSINVGTTNKRVAPVEEYPMKNHKVPKLLPMQGGLNYVKEFLCRPAN
ncbi:hypothetical protein AtNW77_Chr3g0215271 [Arabidopsis thaliana]|uniref:Uncharacterized protein n=2 Tax=Arabidopsis TaxID=3701 RepID=A0A178V9A0_ARATH|nr:hypothetical protein ISN45_At03g051810 [Arabidopsis thaliana x Arabidopsis arenosa]OAP02384.1 hypothetical protein AXX17_AT3G53320 [Arabidopsis thaliana]